MAKKKKKRKIGQMYCSSKIAKCPQCETLVDGTVKALTAHFKELHQRHPTRGEIFQFRSYEKGQSDAKRYTTGYDSHPREVSGGLPSLGKRY